MQYFYHGIPEDMRGSELVPLNRMLEIDPNLRSKYLEKYKGREEILERKVPLLDCGWDDVVQLLPLHPRQLFELQKNLGNIETVPSYKYYQLNPTSLDPAKTVIYFKTAPGEENVTVKWLKDVDLADLQSIPQATRQYYESLVGKDEPVFNYQFVPHILYKGSIDVSSAQIIDL